MLRTRAGSQVVSGQRTEATLQGHESPVSSVPNPSTGLPYWLSSRVNLVETAGAVSSTAAGSYCHLSRSPKGKPTTGSGPTQCDGSESRRGSSINNKVMFLGAAAEKMTEMCSYILCREKEVLNMHSPCPHTPEGGREGPPAMLCKPQESQEHVELLCISFPMQQPHRGKKDAGLKWL